MSRLLSFIKAFYYQYLGVIICINPHTIPAFLEEFITKCFYFTWILNLIISHQLINNVMHLCIYHFVCIVAINFIISYALSTLSSLCKTGLCTAMLNFIVFLPTLTMSYTVTLPNKGSQLYAELTFKLKNICIFVYLMIQSAKEYPLIKGCPLLSSWSIARIWLYMNIIRDTSTDYV